MSRKLEGKFDKENQKLSISHEQKCRGKFDKENRRLSLL